MCCRGRRNRNTTSVEEAKGGAPSLEATCHGASRLASRSDTERFKGFAFNRASIQAASSVLWSPSVRLKAELPTKSMKLEETPCTESKICILAVRPPSLLLKKLDECANRVTMF